MSDLRDLYQEVILEHARKPRNFRRLGSETSRQAKGYNALCGDRIDVYVDLRDGVLQDVSFEGTGCAISMASASMMTQGLKGKTQAEAEALFEKFHRLVTGQDPGSRAGESGDVSAIAPRSVDTPAEGPALGKLELFAGVSEFPVRVKCASLPWHTMQAALHSTETVVSTEDVPTAKRPGH